MAAKHPDPEVIRRRALVVELAAKLTGNQIAERTGYSLSSVYVICRAAGVKPRSPFA